MTRRLLKPPAVAMLTHIGVGGGTLHPPPLGKICLYPNPVGFGLKCLLIMCKIKQCDWCILYDQVAMDAIQISVDSHYTSKVEII